MLLCGGFAIFVLLLRILATGSAYLLFLGYNTILAGIGWALSTMMLNKPALQKGLWYPLLTFAWLLFLPNAPYVFTDLFHLNEIHSKWLWLDTMIILAFAVPSFFLGMQSTADMHRIWTGKYGNRRADAMVVITFFAVGFGIYLGRYLRFNSWDVLHDPGNLFAAIADRFLHPLSHLRTWSFTICSGLFLNLLWFGRRLLHGSVSVAGE